MKRIYTVLSACMLLFLLLLTLAAADTLLAALEILNALRNQVVNIVKTAGSILQIFITVQIIWCGYHSFLSFNVNLLLFNRQVLSILYKTIIT